MLRDRLLARLAEMGDAPDHQRLAAEVLGIRGAPPELARRLVAQALVVEDRRDDLAAARASGSAATRRRRRASTCCGTRTAARCMSARRSTCAGGCARTSPIARWRALKPEMSRAADAEWQRGRIGDRSAAARSGADSGAAAAGQRADGRARSRRRATCRARCVRDVLVVLPSIEADSVELIAARGRRPLDDSADAPQRRRPRRPRAARRAGSSHLARRTRSRIRTPHACSRRWCSRGWRGRGAGATRLDPHDVGVGAARSQRGSRRCSPTSGSFVERLDQR